MFTGYPSEQDSTQKEDYKSAATILKRAQNVDSKVLARAISSALNSLSEADSRYIKECTGLQGSCALSMKEMLDDERASKILRELRM